MTVVTLSIFKNGLELLSQWNSYAEDNQWVAKGDRWPIRYRRVTIPQMNYYGAFLN